MEEIKKIYCGGCANHCLALVKVKDGKVVEQFFEKTDESLSQKLMHAHIMSCARARSAAELVDHPQRLNYPLKRAGERGENKWQRITWEEALDDIANRFQKVKDEYGPEGVAFCNLGENNLPLEYQRRFMHLFGSPTFACQGQV